MRYGIALLALLFAFSVSTVTLHAQGRGNGQAKKQATPSGQTRTKTDSPKAKPVTTKQGAKQTAKADKQAVKAETRVAKAEARAAKKTAPTVTNTTTTTPTTEVTPTTPTTAYVKNPKLEARLLAKLPGVTSIQDASAGFKNWGQFVAAVHASERLRIPFADLKARMTGMTPGTVPGTMVQTAAPMSLGQAMKSFQGVATTPETTGTLSSTQIQTEVKKAEDAAAADLRRTRESN